MPDNRTLLAASLFLWLIAVPTMHAIQPRSAIAAGDVPCDIQHGPCTTKANGMTITFDIRPKPVRPMSELQFTVTVKKNRIPATDASVALDLSMPGMYMGKNRPALKHVGRGVYQGSGIITRCTTGKKTWLAKVTVGRGDPAAIAQYQFEVQ
jgi:hypothetical protein